MFLSCSHFLDLSINFNKMNVCIPERGCWGGGEEGRGGGSDVIVTILSECFCILSCNTK